MEELYSYFISASWFFLLGNVILLLVACLAAFRGDAL